MRIVHIISQLSGGGAERFTVNLCNELSESGHEVYLIIYRSQPESCLFCKQFLNDGIHLYSLDIKKNAPFLKVTLSLRRIIKQIQPDVINCHLDSVPHLMPIYLFSRIKVFHTIHSVASKASGGGGIHAMLYRFLYLTGLVQPITISDLCHDSYIEYYNLHNAIMIPNGCPPAQPTFKLPEVKAEINTYKQTLGTRVFIHVARFNELKNQRLLIEAFNGFDKEGVDFILLVIGRGFDNGPGKVLADSACDKIRFLGEKSNVADYLSCSDAFCLTSIYEGLPISLLEAMSLGVTPICTAAGGVPDVITDGVTGFLSEVNNDSYTKALLRYLSTPLDKQTIAKVYSEKYSMKLCALRYLETYQK